MAIEKIERKWRLADSISNPEGHSEIIVEAFITSTCEISIRSEGDSFFLACTEDEDISHEWKVEAPEWVFKQLIRGAKHEVRQWRTTFFYKTQKLEFDTFIGALAGLVIVKAEWPVEAGGDANAVAAANAFRPPRWLGATEEVTNDDRYENKNLALNGLPY